MKEQDLIITYKDDNGEVVEMLAHKIAPSEGNDMLVMYGNPEQELIIKEGCLISAIIDESKI